MKSDKTKVFECLNKEGILKIFKTLNRIEKATQDKNLKSKLKPVLEFIAIPLSQTKKTNKELSIKGKLKLDKEPYKTLLDYVKP